MTCTVPSIGSKLVSFADLRYAVGVGCSSAATSIEVELAERLVEGGMPASMVSHIVDAAIIIECAWREQFVKLENENMALQKKVMPHGRNSAAYVTRVNAVASAAGLVHADERTLPQSRRVTQH